MLEGHTDNVPRPASMTPVCPSTRDARPSPYPLAAKHAWLRQVQKRLRREMRAALSVADVLLAPTTPFPPFASGGAPADPASLLLNDVLTVPVSLTGVPAISIPVATAPPATATPAAAGSGVRFSGGGGGGARDGAAGNRVAGAKGERFRLPLGMQVGRRLDARTQLVRRSDGARGSSGGISGDLAASVWWLPRTCCGGARRCCEHREVEGRRNGEGLRLE